MRRVTIAVIGNAKTTRANLEALISDVVESVDQATIVTIYNEEPSEALIWATQYAQDKGIETLQYPDNNYEALVAEHKREELRFFMLWDDDDSECQLAASMAQEFNIPAYDLTDGLMLITLNQAPISRPVKTEPPVIEAIVTPTQQPEAEIEEAEELDEEDEDEEGEYDLGELMTLAIEEAGRIFARSFASEFMKLLKK
ncbi:hypothetical protein UFOVP225_2 [uncultured Caudovirales phage]|uniref:Uncharacterized protein n=1 Tax=uncultured Caudovirales phage TaxID=2100421 RepID=A0A6J7WQ88_9CAUD|nr:hypothetical protein UFOVP113_15 [uncultured Caudovirales phage]CAB5218882.1 hypothetical protein UFOVP225_2 [uncultured Caudovirales phage]